MNSLKLRAIVTGAAIVLTALAARGQQRSPRIGYVVPAGGKRGTTLRVAVGGRFLTGASDVTVSGDGVEAMVIECNKPINSAQFQLLRDKFKQLTARKVAARRAALGLKPLPARTRTPAPAKTRSPAKPVNAPAPPTAPPGSVSQAKAKPPGKPTWSDADEKALEVVRYKLRNAPNRKITPALIETVYLEVKVAPDAAPGRRELRLTTNQGVTNPMVFCVGQFREFKESSPVSTAQLTWFGGAKAPPETDPEITLPAVLNGQIMPGDVDRFKFKARKGQKLVVSAAARDLIPYLADAVPGWFEATLSLYNSKGEELAYVDRYRFHPDPVLYCAIEDDGEYTIEIRDSIYRGRQDFVYRISIGQLPFVTSIFPLGGRTGNRTAVELTGWNLPTDSIIHNNRDGKPGIYPISVGKHPRASNPMPFAVDPLPTVLDLPGNDSRQTAQDVTLPIIVDGRVDRPGDRDVFSFKGTAGSEIVAEIVARRLGSPLDSVLELTDATGRRLAHNDDNEDKGAGLETHHADSFIRATLPADGKYYIHLGDTQNKGGREFAYRLRMSPPRPDFELRVAPSSVNMRAGSSVPITVCAIRRDGFSGEIRLSMKPAKSVFKLSGARIPAGRDKVRLTLTAPRVAFKHPVSLAMEGTAKIAGQTVVRRVVPADDMMQAFIYRHMVTAEDLKVRTIGRFSASAMVTIASETPVKIPVGGTIEVKLNLPGRGRGARAFKVELELSDPPEGITIEKASLKGPSPSIVLKSAPDKVKPGLKGNLIVNAYVTRSVPASKGSTRKVRRRFLAGALPAMPFVIIPASP